MAKDGVVKAAVTWSVKDAVVIVLPKLEDIEEEIDDGQCVKHVSNR